jgi:hypothetical protein
MRKRIDDFAARVRLYHNQKTLPWADKGSRLLPTKLYIEYTTAMNNFQTQFDDMVEEFYAHYPTLVAEAPLHLRDLFKADDYPPLEEVKRKFYFRRASQPVPESGDFRLDVPAEALADLKAQYEKQYEAKLNDAMRSAWERLHDMLTEMSKKLTDTGDVKKRWHDSFVTNANELVELLGKLNVTNDPKLEQARRELEIAMVGIDIEDIKESADTRADLKRRVDAINSKFDW